MHKKRTLPNLLRRKSYSRPHSHVSRSAKRSGSSLPWLAVVVPAVAIVVSGIFSYENIASMRANYATSHAPKLQPAFLGVKQSDDGHVTTISVIAYNDSDGAAKNAQAHFSVFAMSEKPAAILATFLGLQPTSAKDFRPHETQILSSEWKTTRLVTSVRPIFLDAYAEFTNIQGDLQPTVRFCATYNGAETQVVSCSLKDELPRHSGWNEFDPQDDATQP